jgi:predicted DNA-binding transcriptional regulator AlpA
VSDVGETFGGRLLTAAAVGEMLGFAPGTILDWFERGVLPGFKLARAVRFSEAEILAWVEARRVGPGAGGEVSPTPTAHPTQGVVSQSSPTPLGGGTRARETAWTDREAP